MKFVFIQWVGEDVKPMTKGKISTHKSTVEKTFHVSFALNYGVFVSVRRTLYFVGVHAVAITAHRTGSLKEPVLPPLIKAMKWSVYRWYRKLLYILMVRV